MEGLITLGLGARDNEQLELKCKAPVVSVDVYYDRQRVANVGLDDRDAGRQMAEYLIKCGHKKICFLSDNDVGVDHERCEGVRDACREYGHGKACVRHIIIPEEHMERKAYYGEYLTELSRMNDALFFASDYYAAEAVTYMRDMGINVPEDISVAGFDDSEAASLCRPRLTTMGQDISRKGEAAVRKLFDYIEGTGGRTIDEKLTASLVIRDSVKVKADGGL